MNRYLNFTLIILSLAQLLLGALVQAQPGLTCVDWPLCYGSFSPATSVSSFYEVSHRTVAGLLLIGTLILALKEKAQGRKAWLPFFWVLLQAVLGWITFSYRLPTVVSLAHLVAVPLLLVSLIALWPEEKPSASYSRHAKDLPFLFVISALFLLMLGGLIRKTSGGLLHEAGPLIFIKQLHRSLGILTVIGMLMSWPWLMRAQATKPSFLYWPPVFALIQLVVGVLLWRSEPSTTLRLIHMGSAGLLIFSLFALRAQLVQREQNPVPGWLGDFLLLTKARLGTLVMATVLVGMLLAPFQLTFLASLGVFIGIAMQAMGACALNCVIEKDIDARMERTKIRPLPGGRMTVMTANLIGWGLVVIGTLLIMFLSNGLTAFLGVFTVVIYLYAYTPLKTRSPWALVVGAIPGATPPLMGWTAVTGEISGVGLYLFLFLFFWQLPHFLAIAVYHQEDYQNASILTFFKDKNATFIKRWVLLLSLVLGGLGFFPYDAGGSSAAFHFATLVLGGAFFGLALQGWLMKDEGEDFRRWARNYFLGTLFYLPLQFAAMLMLP